MIFVICVYKKKFYINGYKCWTEIRKRIINFFLPNKCLRKS